MLCSMKFLLECVSCYGTPTPPLSEDPLPAPSRRPSSRSLCRPDWKPSLNAISEDNVAAAGPPTKPKPRPKLNKKKAPNTTYMSRSASERRSAPHRSSPAASTVPRSRSHRTTNPYGQITVPSFAPTPFMF